MIDKIRKLEQRYIQLTEQQIEESKDKITERNKWMPNKISRLNKQSAKKPEYVLVQYLRNNKLMDFQLCKIISGNIVVIDNKGHKLNPSLIWRHGKFFWYIIGEWDTEPISPRYLDKIRSMQRSTENHPILIKMILGAVQKKEELKKMKVSIWVIIGVVVAGLIVWSFLGGK
jgi:hypothetical protein